MLHSISKITKQLPSNGSSPVVVMCSDYAEYACKYGNPHKLFNELLAANFARCWDISTPEFELIKINEEHLINGLRKSDFTHPCFGSKYIDHAVDINQFFTTFKNNSYELSKISNREEILKIGLFDIWLSNEDRNHNNTNLLLSPENERHILAIDHVDIFNSNQFNYDFTQITFDESIINTEYAHILLKKGDKLKENIHTVSEKFYLWVDNCKDVFPKVLNSLPKEWSIDVDEKKEKIAAIFENKWLEETLKTFKLYSAESFKNTK